MMYICNLFFTSKNLEKDIVLFSLSIEKRCYLEWNNDWMTREKDFLTFIVARFKVSRMSSSSTDLLNDERNLARTRHLQR